MSHQFESEHAELLNHADGLLADLAQIDSNLSTGDVSHEQHRVYVGRAAALSDQLVAALAVARDDRYSAALSLLRPALEQLIFDRLLALGSRYVQRIPDVTQATFERWRREWKEGAEWTRNIRRLEQDQNGLVRLTLHGLTSSDPESNQTISVYLFLLHEYRPFVAPVHDQARLLPQFRTRARQQEHALTQHEIYHTALRWPVLLSNLRLNGLANAADLLRISVHYRFLSAFVHPLNDHQSKLYGRGFHARRSLQYDHYSSELVVLYVVAFALYELDTLLRASARPPTFALRNATALTRRMELGRAGASHLWFVGDEPHIFDRIQDANRRSWDAPPSKPRALVDPHGLRASEVRYYQDPLLRLVALHRSTNELMGHSFASLWNRPDGHFR